MKKRKSGSGIGFGQRRIAVERLESRAMLAGNVSAFVDGGGNLIVRGNNGDNGVLISQVDDGEYAVIGFDFGSGATNINGSANGAVVLTGVTGDVNVDLRGGNDALAIGNVAEDLALLAENCGFGIGIGSGSGSGSEAALVEPVEGRFFVPRNLIVNTGDGNDGVAITADVNGFVLINAGNGNDGVAFGNLAFAESDVNIDSSLTILTGNGNDIACASLVTLRGLLNIQTGNGNDVVTAFEFDAGHVLAITGGGNDVVTITTFDTDREVVVDTGAGNDDVVVADFSAGQGFGPNEQTGAGYVTVVTGNGNDEAELVELEADGVVLNTGAGNDGSPNAESPITVFDAEITNHLVVVTAGGNDIVEVDLVAARTVVVDAGAGNDTVAMRNFPGEGEETSPEIGNLTVNTSGGNDLLTLENLEIRNNLFASLGAGNDFLDAFGLTVNGNAFIDAGAGNDDVTIANSFINGNTTILMGSGNDTLTIFGSSSNGRLIARGGPGRDTFNNDLGIDSNGTEGDTDVREFEVFNLGD
jgi:hypothetical protein